MIRKYLLTLATSAALVAGAFTSTAVAQTQPPAVTALAPALRAAVLSGNATAIQAAINTLSGGDNAKKAQLAKQVAAAAEVLVATNPTAATAAAQVALTISQTPAVKAAAPADAAAAAASVTNVAAQVSATNPQFAAMVSSTLGNTQTAATGGAGPGGGTGSGTNTQTSSGSGGAGGSSGGPGGFSAGQGGGNSGGTSQGAADPSANR